MVAVTASSSLTADNSTTVVPTNVTRQNHASKVVRTSAEVAVGSTPSP